MTWVQAAISTNIHRAEVSLSKTPPAPDAYSVGESDLWPYCVGGQKTEDFPYEDQHGLTTEYIITEKKKWNISNH